MNRYQKEIKALKRENQRLRKMLNRAEETVQEFCDPNFEEELEEEEREERLKKRADKKARKAAKEEAQGKLCPTCGAKTEEMPIGPFNFLFCVDKCGFRKKIK